MKVGAGGLDLRRSERPLIRTSVGSSVSWCGVCWFECPPVLASAGSIVDWYERPLVRRLLVRASARASVLARTDIGKFP